MKLLIIFSILISQLYNDLSKSKIDVRLQMRIAKMFKSDQKWRLELDNIQKGKKSSYSEKIIDQMMAKADRENMIEAKQIIKKFGFPGYALVGEKGSGNFWAIIQHCDDDIALQQQVLLLMAKEVKKHNASGENFAYLQDRVLTNQGKKQIYGTQIHVDFKTHQAKPFPIQDSLNVDSRRKKIGLSPLKNYVKLFERH